MADPINRITEDDLNSFGMNPWMDRYQMIATKSAIYPGQGTSLGLVYCALKLNGEAGELAEHVGKAMRDDGMLPVVQADGMLVVGLNNLLLSERHALLVKEVGDVLWYLSAICNELRISLADAAAANLAKLKDRTDRDALRGSGDER